MPITDTAKPTYAPLEFGSPTESEMLVHIASGTIPLAGSVSTGLKTSNDPNNPAGVC